MTYPSERSSLHYHQRGHHCNTIRETVITLPSERSPLQYHQYVVIKKQRDLYYKTTNQVVSKNVTQCNPPPITLNGQKRGMAF
jgi:hypothetical protein